MLLECFGPQPRNKLAKHKACHWVHQKSRDNDELAAQNGAFQHLVPTSIGFLNMSCKCRDQSLSTMPCQSGLDGRKGTWDHPALASRTAAFSRELSSRIQTILLISRCSTDQLLWMSKRDSEPVLARAGCNSQSRFPVDLLLQFHASSVRPGHGICRQSCHGAACPWPNIICSLLSQNQDLLPHGCLAVQRQ